MQQTTLTLSPQEAHKIEAAYRVVRRSIDARQRRLRVNLTVLTDDEGHYIPLDAPLPLYEEPHFPQREAPNDSKREAPNAKHQTPPTVAIVGAGPAGLFAALTLLEHGIKPVIYERGADVSTRKQDIAQLNRNMGLNSESNYCFGEGGAGTFSDGKLFSRSKKRGNMQRVMELFHYFGATDRVLYEAHAHIGSDKLPTVIRRMRECILAHGGEIHFNHRIDSLAEFGINAEGTKREAPNDCIAVILAIGHSAHDTYEMLEREGVRLESKGFAMGVRCEHPQTLINRLMYHNPDAETLRLVGNASYSLVTQANGRGVYSFCMCPGGHIVPAGSQQQSCVVNGMSASHRNSPYANSGMVVEIRPEDLPTLAQQLQLQTTSNAEGTKREAPNASDGLLGLRVQQALEQRCFSHGGPAAQAPAQRLEDFVKGRASKTLPASSYLPGMVASRLDEWLPEHIGRRLQQGFRDFDKKYPGFLTNDAVILGVESRSSSAVRIPRDAETLQSVSTPGLYPCGEGAGYAGGITSSALDGINAALKIAELAGLA